jgi:hypothetical protein
MLLRASDGALPHIQVCRASRSIGRSPECAIRGASLGHEAARLFQRAGPSPRALVAPVGVPAVASAVKHMVVLFFLVIVAGPAVRL